MPSPNKLTQKLKYTFKDSSLLQAALTHRSVRGKNNERLEFLGDSLLNFVIAERLYHHLSNAKEGELSRLRASLVNGETLAEVAQELQLGDYLRLGPGELKSGGFSRKSILADALEAIIGAIYLDGGLEAAKAFLFNNFSKQIESTLETPLHNWKALLQDYCQKNYQQTPHYQVLQESGPDHSKMFKISVCVNQKELGQGIGASKKEAQQAAAADALSRFVPPPK